MDGPPEELAPSLTTTPHQREDVSALDRFNVHRCPHGSLVVLGSRTLMTCLWFDYLPNHWATTSHLFVPDQRTAYCLEEV
ncbi:hypothetical protein TNCV_2012451 [Trichonephila clavipes]|nr:hypothetical protein TNCV_2012451 [Trichonephila clavipes]